VPTPEPDGPPEPEPEPEPVWASRRPGRPGRPEPQGPLERPEPEPLVRTVPQRLPDGELISWRHRGRLPPARRERSLEVCVRQAARRSTMLTGRTRPFLEAWLEQSCFRLRALLRARRLGPLPRLSCLGPSQGRHADRRYGCGLLIGARSSGAHQRWTRFQLDGSDGLQRSMWTSAERVDFCDILTNRRRVKRSTSA
jgi:hypothetical protein